MDNKPLSNNEVIKVLERIRREQWCECIGNCQCNYEQDKEALSQAISAIKELEELKERIDVGKLKLVLSETRKNKCITCKYQYDSNACIIHQIKNRNYCQQDLTDEEIIKAIVNYLGGVK